MCIRACLEYGRSVEVNLPLAMNYSRFSASEGYIGPFREGLCNMRIPLRSLNLGHFSSTDWFPKEGFVAGGHRDRAGLLDEGVQERILTKWSILFGFGCEGVLRRGRSVDIYC
jgi:hypothetical protein